MIKEGLAETSIGTKEEKTKTNMEEKIRYGGKFHQTQSITFVSSRANPGQGRLKGVPEVRTLQSSREEVVPVGQTGTFLLFDATWSQSLQRDLKGVRL